MRTIKKIIALCFACILGCSGLMQNVDSVVWAESEQDMESEFQITLGVVEKYLGNDKVVVIPDGVKEIGSSFMRDNLTVEEVIIPDSVKEIDQYAFEDCINLKKIQIPKSVNYFGAKAFENTPWLNERRAENPLVIVNDILIDGRKAKGNVVIPDGVKKIADSAFSGINLTGVVIPSSVEIIGGSAFHRCLNLKTVKFSEGLKEISGWAFYGCESLESIRLPDTLESIGERAFWDATNLEHIYIPKNIEHIGFEAFLGTKWLDNKREENPVVVANNIVIDTAKATGEIEIPYGVTQIGENAFGRTINITAVKVPSTVKRIESGAFSYTGGLNEVIIYSDDISIEEEAFCGCRGLQSVVIADTTPVVNINAFKYCVSYTTDAAVKETEQITQRVEEVEQPVIYTYIKGDANDDWKITLEDAATVLKVALKITDEASLPEGLSSYLDLNSDGNIGLRDAQITLEMALRIIDYDNHEHEWDNTSTKDINKGNSCIETTREYVCTICGETKTEVTNNHTPDWKYSNDGNTRTMTCTKCDTVTGIQEHLYNETVWGYYDYDLAQELFEQANRARTEATYAEHNALGGVSYVGNVLPVAQNEKKTAYAERRAVEVPTDFSHNGVTSYYIGENLARGFDTPYDTLLAWSASHDHSGTMTYQYYTCAGAAWFWYDEDGTGENLVGYAVMEYGGDDWMEDWE